MSHVHAAALPAILSFLLGMVFGMSMLFTIIQRHHAVATYTGSLALFHFLEYFCVSLKSTPTNAGIVMHFNCLFIYILGICWDYLSRFLTGSEYRILVGLHCRIDRILCATTVPGNLTIVNSFLWFLN
jgi:hypothetical protein